MAATLWQLHYGKNTMATTLWLVFCVVVVVVIELDLFCIHFANVFKPEIHMFSNFSNSYGGLLLLTKE